jgi:hypothetical protein
MTSYVLNKDGTNPVTHRDDIGDMTNLTIKIGFVGIGALLLVGLLIFLIIALT